MPPTGPTSLYLAFALTRWHATMWVGSKPPAGNSETGLVYVVRVVHSFLFKASTECREEGAGGGVGGSWVEKSVVGLSRRETRNGKKGRVEKLHWLDGQYSRYIGGSRAAHHVHPKMVKFNLFFFFFLHPKVPDQTPHFRTWHCLFSH